MTALILAAGLVPFSAVAIAALGWDVLRRAILARSAEEVAAHREATLRELAEARVAITEELGQARAEMARLRSEVDSVRAAQGARMAMGR